MKRLSLVLASLSFLVLAGCSTTGTVATDTAEDRDARDAAQADARSGADARGADTARGFDGDPLDDPDSLLAERTVYFEFDSSEISARDMEILRAHAEYLARNPALNIVVEGHTDERGSREYNLALGERRANAVKRILTLNGVSPDQVESISFGEESPVALGSNEEAWRQNRRGQLVYPQR